MLCFVDSHCHMSAPEFAEDLEDVIKRATKAGVRGLITVTEEASEFERAIHLSRMYPGLVAPCLGIHPVQACGSGGRRSVTMQDLEAALPLFEKYRDDIVAVGEIGLDFTPWCTAIQQRDEQLAVFRKQLQIAQEMELPVNVHSRSAAKMTVSVLKEQGVARALLHNFAGRLSVGLEAVQAGYLLSFPPAICRSEQRVKLLRQIPLEHICLETDSPALAADRHVRNEPRNIRLNCEYIAQVKGLTVEKVMEATAINALRLFSRARIMLGRTDPVTQ